MAAQGRPVQLVQVDDAGRCHLQDAAVAILNQIRGQLAVVGIAGICRTGKSFLLNRLLGSQNGFEIGPSVNPCTKGLWIWDTPVQVGPDVHCVFLDTEGLGSTQRTASCDMQIFSLCILLSSYFIYNSLGAIDEQAIEDLDLVLHLAGHIHFRSGGREARQGRSELAQHFPAFLWVLRDFFLRLVDERGAPITEGEYLENALRDVPGQDDKNKVRSAVKELFASRDCATLPRPVADEKDLRVIQQMPYESLRPKFREKTEALVQRVYRSMRPKLVSGGAISGATLAALAAEYCGAINSGAVPSIQSAWASAVQQLLRERKHAAIAAYRERFGAGTSGRLPMDEEQLRELHAAASAEALALLAAPGLDATDLRVRECRADLEHGFARLYEEVRAQNRTASMLACERLAAQLYEERIVRKLSVPGAYSSIQELMADWTQLREVYSREALGPAQGEVASTWILQRMSESVQQLWAELKNHTDQHLGVMVQRVQEAEARTVDVHSTMAQQVQEAEARAVDVHSAMAQRVQEVEAEHSRQREIHNAMVQRVQEAEARTVDVHSALEAERSRQRDMLEAARQEWLSERAQLASQLDDAKRQLDMAPQLPPPSVPGHVAAAMASHMWKRARTFACRAFRGLPCRVVDRESGQAVPARCRLEAGAEALVVEELQPSASSGGPSRSWRCELLELRNVWLCADSELANLAFRALRRGLAEAGRVMLLDGPPAMLGIVVHSSQGREDLLDGLAVLIAVQRSQKEPELVKRCSPGGLRPPGLSLQSVHISGPICGWLAKAGEGSPLLEPPESSSETRLALLEAAEALGMGDVWRFAGR